MESTDISGTPYQSDRYLGDKQYATREELRRRFILRLSTKCISTKLLFHEMQEKHDEEKAGKPWLLILFVGRIGRKELLDILVD